jgi:hypothetical protein
MLKKSQILSSFINALQELEDEDASPIPGRAKKPDYGLKLTFGKLGGY